MTEFLRIVALALVCAATLMAQTPPVVVLTVDIDNSVSYRFDIADPAKRGLDHTITTPTVNRAFLEAVAAGDIVAINGKPAKGIHAIRGMVMGFSATPAPGFGIADVSLGGFTDCNWYFADKDGNFVGQLLDGGLTVPHLVKGGSGAFFGARGEHHFIGDPSRPQRVASAGEDPAWRRLLGGGAYRVVFYLIPPYYPEVETAGSGPAVFHADFTPVSDASPARSGELLVIRAKGLGPTRPALLPPGAKPFGADPLEVVNSPVEVTVGGRDAEVLNKVGWPGTLDRYRLDLRVPSGVGPGKAMLQITSAWIAGAETAIPIR